MAALDSSQPRRKKVTYGKPSHKRVQGYNYDDLFATPQRLQESTWDAKGTIYDSKHQVSNGRAQAVSSRVANTDTRMGESRPNAAMSVGQKRTTTQPVKPKIARTDRLQSPFNIGVPAQARNTASSIFDVPSSEDEMDTQTVNPKHTSQTSQFNRKPSISEVSRQEDLSIFDFSDTTGSNEFDSRSASTTPRKRRKVAAPVSQQRSPVSLEGDGLLQQRISVETTNEYTTVPKALSPLPERQACKGIRSPDRTCARPTHSPRPAPSKAQGQQVARSLPPEQRLGGLVRCKDNGGAPERTNMSKGVGLKSKPVGKKGLLASDALEHAVSARPALNAALGSQSPDEIVQPGGRAPSPALAIQREERSRTPPSVVKPSGNAVAPRQARRLNRLLAEGLSTEMEPNSSELANSDPSGYEHPNLSGTVAPQAWAPETSRARPRKRLIDSLATGTHDTVAEKDSTDKDINISDTDPVNSQTRLPINEPHDTAEPIPSRESEGSFMPSSTTIPAITNAPLANQRGGPRVTYAQQRSFLSDAMLDETSIFDVPLDLEPGAHYQGGRKNARGGGPFPGQLHSLDEEQDTVDDASGGAIRSIHELREAGGNKRFLDEMEALFEDIEDRGTNSLSRRRSALLELGSKLAEKSFARRFVDNSFSQRLLVQLDVECDIIASTVLASSMIFTMDDTVAAHSALKLYQEGATQMLLRLLGSDRDISLIAKERRTNMSKVAQSLVSDYRELIKDSSIWAIGAPQRVSPRLIALRGLELIIRQMREEGTAGLILPRGAINEIVQVLVPFSTWQSQVEPTATDRLELELALSVLESCTVNVGFVFDESILTAESLNTISQILPSISRWSEKDFKQMILLTLRLYLSITNNSPVNCDAFAKPDLLSALVGIVHSKFKCLLGHLEEDQRLYELDVLVLGLGLLINLAELSGIARLSVLGSDGGCLLEVLLRIFLERLEKAAEADSMEESQSNVAFGYLSVFLGSLCQDPGVSRLLRSRLPGGTLQPLMYAVDEFLRHHKMVDDLYDAEGGSNPGSGFTARLQLVVDRMK